MEASARYLNSFFVGYFLPEVHSQNHKTIGFNMLYRLALRVVVFAVTDFGWDP
jgi:hypothetical protein